MLVLLIDESSINKGSLVFRGRQLEGGLVGTELQLKGNSVGIFVTTTLFNFFSFNNTLLGETILIFAPSSILEFSSDFTTSSNTVHQTMVEAKCDKGQRVASSRSDK